MADNLSGKLLVAFPTFLWRISCILIQSIQIYNVYQLYESNWEEIKRYLRRFSVKIDINVYRPARCELDFKTLVISRVCLGRFISL